MFRLTEDDNPYNDPYHDRESCGDVMCRIELAEQGAFDEGAKAQLKKVVRAWDDKFAGSLSFHKTDILAFWQELLKEIE